MSGVVTKISGSWTTVRTDDGRLFLCKVKGSFRIRGIRTTNPVEGKALVQALASLMHKRDSLTMITTHYGNLGISCRRLRVRGFVENMVDIPLTAQNINRFIDYSLIPDDSDEVPHEAIKIAEMLSCHPDLIASAKLFLQDA